MSFRSNFEKIETEFASAMDLEAGKGVKVRGIFNAIRALEEGKVKTLSEAFDGYGFKSQNSVYKAICAMFENMGTPVSELTNPVRKQKLDGTQFALNLLASKGISLDKPKVQKPEKTTVVTSSGDTVEVNV